jgi:ferredoxin-NADP reductase
MTTPDPRYFTVTVGSITDFGNDTREYELRFLPGETMEFVPGQFVAVLCPKDGKVIRRAYSIASPPEEKGHLALLIKLVQSGTVTNWFWSLKEGDRLKIHGPFGKFVLPDRVDFEVIFVAVGTGVAPFRSMIRSMLSKGFSGKMTLIFGSRYDGMIPYHQEWLTLAQRHPNFRYIPTISRPSGHWSGETGYVQTKLEKYCPDPTGKRVYICGLKAMIEAVQTQLLQMGYQKDQIFYERYD